MHPTRSDIRPVLVSKRTGPRQREFHPNFKKVVPLKRSEPVSIPAPAFNAVGAVYPQPRHSEFKKLCNRYPGKPCYCDERMAKRELREAAIVEANIPGLAAQGRSRKTTSTLQTIINNLTKVYGGRANVPPGMIREAIRNYGRTDYTNHLSHQYEPLGSFY